MLPNLLIGPILEYELGAEPDDPNAIAGDDLQQSVDEAALIDTGIREAILNKLSQRGIRLSKDFQLEVLHGAVFFRGRVQSFYQRQLIIHSVRFVPGVSAVHQAIDVIPPEAGVRKPHADDRRDISWRRTGKAVALLALALILSSCSKAPKTEPVYPVEGQVLFNGDPTPGAYVVFHPVGNTDPAVVRPSARVEPNGSFHVGTFTKEDGAPEGSYVVTVEWRKLVTKGKEAVPGRNVLPAKYSKPETSGLRVNVNKGSNSIGPLQLSASSGADAAVR